MDSPDAQRQEFAHLLRGIAAGAVVIHHYGVIFRRNPEIVAGLIGLPSLPVHPGSARLAFPDFGINGFWGFFGVGLFFLISGFVIPFSIASLSRREFAVARLFRIWPVYWGGLAVTLLCIRANSFLASIPFPVSASEIVSHFLILPRWPTLTRPIDGIIWTLEIEVFFYAICLVLHRRIRNMELPVLAYGVASVPAAAIMTALLQHLPPSRWWLAPAHYASSMLLFTGFISMGTAFWYHHRGRVGWGGLLAAQGLQLAAFTAAWRLGPYGSGGWSGPISFAVAYVVFLGAYAGRSLVRAVPRALLAPARRLADISYPLYAVHAVMGYSILANLQMRGVSAAASLFLAVAISLLAAAILHVVIEKPSRRLGRNLARRSASPRRGDADEEPTDKAAANIPA